MTNKEDVVRRLGGRLSLLLIGPLELNFRTPFLTVATPMRAIDLVPLHCAEFTGRRLETCTLHHCVL